MPTTKLLLRTPRFDVVETADPDAHAPRKAFVRHPGAVVVLALLPGDRLCLIRNRRVAVGKTLIEAPAGTREPTEPPAETARRELAEETGYSAGAVREAPGFFMSPGILNERMHVFVAEDLTRGEPRREPGEQIENLEVTWDDALAMVQRGEIEDAKTIAALLYYATFERAARDGA